MRNETKSNGASSLGGGGLRAKMEHYVYSGEKKHGIGIFTEIFHFVEFFVSFRIIGLTKITWKRLIKLASLHLPLTSRLYMP
uniref:Uncharacterized protein n=1 Tax=Brassica oleracea TaxID=3712 RepID=A0A3P6GC06_BRAOL|nr:unnamed protein product [Brassica oleracea]